MLAGLNERSGAVLRKVAEEIQPCDNILLRQPQAVLIVGAAIYAPKRCGSCTRPPVDKLLLQEA
eukprot:9783451-Prorocentrum_lima.AAC.1